MILISTLTAKLISLSRVAEITGMTVLIHTLIDFDIAAILQLVKAVEISNNIE